MTHADWLEAFRKGDPNVLGDRVLAALRQAANEHNATAQDADDHVDIGTIGEHLSARRQSIAHEVCQRAGVLLRDWGSAAVLPPPNPEHAE